MKTQICPKPLSNGISYQCSRGHLLVPSRTRCPLQIKTFFSLLLMAAIFSWFPIVVNANKKHHPHHLSYWLFFQCCRFQTSPARMKNIIFTSHREARREGGLQRNKGRGVLGIQSEARVWSAPSSDFFLFTESSARYSGVPNQLFQWAHHTVWNRDPLKLCQEESRKAMLWT